MTTPPSETAEERVRVLELPDNPFVFHTLFAFVRIAIYGCGHTDEEVKQAILTHVRLDVDMHIVTNARTCLQDRGLVICHSDMAHGHHITREGMELVRLIEQDLRVNGATSPFMRCLPWHRRVATV